MRFDFESESIAVGGGVLGKIMPHDVDGLKKWYF